MTNIKFGHLANPPIKEVIIGLLVDGLFIDKDEIEKFSKNFTQVDKFIKQETIKSVTFELSDEPKIYQNVSEGKVLKTRSENEEIHILPNKIMFVDKTKYKDFETFYSKFEPIIRDIKSIYSQEIEIKDIGLRYINDFIFSEKDAEENFKISRTLITDIDENRYALMKDYLAVARILSAVDNNMFATIKTIFKQISPVALNITFDIDTHLKKPYVLDDLTDLKTKVYGLKEFKNHIFFSNFKDIHNIKEFK